MSNRLEKIIEASTWLVLIIVIFGVRFLPVKLLDNESAYILIGAIASFVLLYYFVIYKYFARSNRIYLKNIADIILVGVLIHLLKDYGEYFFALYFLPIAAAALELKFFNALLIATIASVFVIFEIVLSSQGLIPQTNQFYGGIWQIILILFITIFCRMLAIQLKQERVAKEESLARQKVLEEEDKRQKEFLSLTSHQLFTPLSMIRGFVSMLNDENFGKLTPKQKDAVSEIYENTKRSIGLVDELLSISRIQSGKYILTKKYIYLDDLVTKTVGEFNKTLNNKNLKITFEKNKHHEPINVDPEKIRQVVSNLLDNAIKYTKKGTIAISTSQGSGKTFFKICDSGMGICDSDFNKLFQPFFRGRNILELDNKGTGLGLFISKLIVKKHGGKIWAEGSQEKGAIFAFEIPNNYNTDNSD